MRDIYIAIMVAAEKGNGLRLTADEVFQLAGDEAVGVAAMNALDRKDWPDDRATQGPDWSRIDPHRDRQAENLTYTRSDRPQQRS